MREYISWDISYIWLISTCNCYWFLTTQITSLVVWGVFLCEWCTCQRPCPPHLLPAFHVASVTFGAIQYICLITSTSSQKTEWVFIIPNFVVHDGPLNCHNNSSRCHDHKLGMLLNMYFQLTVCLRLFSKQSVLSTSRYNLFRSQTRQEFSEIKSNLSFLLNHSYRHIWFAI